MTSTAVGPIVIACAADEDYAMPLAAMIKSMLVNLDPSREISLYIVDGGITHKSKERLRLSWASDRLAVYWLVPPDDASMTGLPLWGRMTVNAYHRLKLPDLLPSSLQKAIWLDCDLIVKGNVAELWDIDVNGWAVLAVQDLVVPYASSRYGIARFRALGIPQDAKYFNSGVMVVNLDWWRERDVTARVLHYLRTHGATVVFYDQEGLNAALVGQWEELDPRWNQIAGVTGRAFFKAEHLEDTVYQEVVNDPRIVHYAGNLKPWAYHNRSASRSLYFEYVDQTAWAGWRPPKTLKSIAVGIYDAALRDLMYPAEKWWMMFARARG